MIEILTKTVADPGFSVKTKARNVNLFFGHFPENGTKSKKMGGGLGVGACIPSIPLDSPIVDVFLQITNNAITDSGHTCELV